MDKLGTILPKVSSPSNYVPPVYPDSRIWPAELSSMLDNPRAVRLEVYGPPASCWNCGGAGSMYLFMTTAGPFPAPSGKVKWLSGQGIKDGWYQGETHSAPCPRCNSENWKEYLRANCGLKGADLDLTIAGFKAGGPFIAKEPARDLAAEALSKNTSPNGFLTFWGKPGRGKSHLLKGLVNGFRGIGVFSRYINASELINDIRERFSDDRGGISVENVIAFYKNIKVLAIDELEPDKVNLTNWTRETLNRLINSRYEDETLLTVIAMNRDPEDLPEDMAYLSSRCRGGGSIEVKGDDMRWSGSRGAK